MAKPALVAYVEQLYGGAFNIKSDVVSVGTARQQLVGNDFERMFLLFAVLGSGNVFVSPDLLAAVNHGIPLLGQGATLPIDARADLVLPGFSWTAIATPSAVDVMVIQVIRYLGNQPAAS